MKIKKVDSILRRTEEILFKKGVSINNSLVLFNTIEENDRLLSYYRDGIIKNFFTRRGCYESLLKNINKRIRSVTNPAIDVKGYVLGAFSWNDTPEGHMYWRNIDLEYTKFISDYEDKKKAGVQE